MEEILRSQLKYAPEIFAAEQQYQPLYAQLQQRMMRDEAQAQADLALELAPKLTELERQVTRGTQELNLEAVQQRAKPMVQGFLDAAGTAGIAQNLQQVGEELSSQRPDYTMTPEEQRAVEQQARAAYAARGIALGDQAALTEVLNRNQFMRARKMEEEGLRANRLQLATGIAQTLQQQAAPAMGTFFGPSLYAGNFAGNTIQSALMGQGQAGAQYFNAESPTGMGAIYGGHNALVQGGIGQAQASAAAGAGRMGMAGGIGGGLLVGAGIAF
jgi:hypothetical protein